MSPFRPHQNTAGTFQIYEKLLGYRPESQIGSRYKQKVPGTYPKNHRGLWINKGWGGVGSIHEAEKRHR